MTTTYKKELYSLPLEIVESLISYAKENKQKKSHIVAEAIQEYVKKKERIKSAKEAKKIIGIISNNSLDIQDIKAHKYD